MSDKHIKFSYEASNKLEQLIEDIMQIIFKKIKVFYFEADETVSNSQHLALISMIIINILANMVFHSVESDLPKEARLEALKYCLKDIELHSFKLWDVLEAHKEKKDKLN